MLNLPSLRGTALARDSFDHVIVDNFVPPDAAPSVSTDFPTIGTTGSVHTDAKWKIISVLLYLNQQWTDEGGRLRLLLAFRRADNSWHGHLKRLLRRPA